jgi:hypothetical protein
MNDCSAAMAVVDPTSVNWRNWLTAAIAHCAPLQSLIACGKNGHTVDGIEGCWKMQYFLVFHSSDEVIQ